MGEIVYTRTEGDRDKVVSEEHFWRGPVETKQTIFVGPDKVAAVESLLVAGKIRNTDKMYWKWRTVASVGFYRNRAGSPQPYHAFRPWDFKLATPWSHRIANIVFEMLDGESEMERSFTRACGETFGITKVSDLYPIAGMYGIENYKYLPFNLRPGMRLETWESYATKTFGKTRATPRLIAAVKSTEPYIVSLAHQFRGLVPDEDIVSFMENNFFDDEMESGIWAAQAPRVRRVARAMNEKSRKAILASGIDLSDMKRIQTASGMNGGYMAEIISAAGEELDIRSWSDLDRGSGVW